MNRFTLVLISYCFLSGISGECAVHAEEQLNSLPAFPGAQGFGSTTPGGRGGRVIKVTNLNTSGPGSLQAACSAEGPRIVVFDTSGVIPGDVVIDQNRITIAGQSAPGAGITIQGRLMTPYSREARFSDIVVRFLRIRPDPSTGASGDGIQFGRVSNCVIDHVSCAWGNDEVIDVYNANKLAIQWCTIEESDTEGHNKGIHNFGLINGPDGGRFSLHHTLFAHNRRRNPAVAHGPSDIRNIVVYDFRDGLSHEGHPPNNLGFNLIGNYYKPGPSSPDIFPFCFVDTISYYLRDNYIEGVGIIQDPWAEADKLYGLRYYAQKGRRAVKETTVPHVTTFTPQEAYELVLDQAGCFPRDAITNRTIEEVRNGEGEWGRHEPNGLMTGLSTWSPLKDTDADGMPDCWEEANGLDPTDGGDYTRVMESSYTAIEEYLNILARRLIETKGIMSEPGDVNADGKVGFSDLFPLVWAVISGTYSWASDINVDSRMSMGDLGAWWDICSPDDDGQAAGQSE
ncbi:polysaccharide lyase family 1 protein [Gemmatimonadota bacterium]